MAGTKLDFQQVIQNIYDEPTNRIRVDAEVTIGSITVDLSHTTDSVRLGDGTNFLTSTTVGPKTALDVSVINSLAISVDAADGDNLAIHDSDGDELEINTDGSINVKTVQLFTIPFDAITATYPSATQEVYASRVGGIAGTVQQTATVNYTDSTKSLILNVAVV